MTSTLNDDIACDIFNALRDTFNSYLPENEQSGRSMPGSIAIDECIETLTNTFISSLREKYLINKQSFAVMDYAAGEVRFYEDVECVKGQEEHWLETHADYKQDECYYMQSDNPIKEVHE